MAILIKTGAQADKYRNAYKKAASTTSFKTPTSTVAPKLSNTAPAKGASEPISQTNWNDRSTPVVEQEAPSWIPKGDRPTGGGGSRSSSSDYDNIVDAINAEKKKQTDLMLGNIRAAYDEQRADYSNQIPTVQQDASTMRNRIDTGYYQSLPELYRAMEAGGQRGGENITGMVGLNTTRMEGQNQANLYETNQVQNIRNALSGLDTSQIQAETQAQSGINSDAFANLMTAMRDSAAQTKTNLNTAKSDFENTIGAFSSDYQAEINRLTNLMSTGQTNDMDGVSIAYKIAALNRERNQKIKDKEAAAYEASLDSESNALAWARLNKTGGSGANESPLEYDEAFILYQQGDRSPAVKRALGIQ